QRLASRQRYMGSLLEGTISQLILLSRERATQENSTDASLAAGLLEFLKPCQRPLQHIDTMLRLLDAVPFAGIDHHLGRHPVRAPRLMEHPAHRKRTAAVIA